MVAQIAGNPTAGVQSTLQGTINFQNPCNDLSDSPFEFTPPADQPAISNNNFDGAVTF